MARDRRARSVASQGVSRGVGFSTPSAVAAARRQLLSGRAAVVARQHVLNNAPQRARAIQRAAGEKIVSLFTSSDMVAAKDIVSQSKAARDAAKLRFTKNTAAAQKAWDEAKAARELLKGTFSGTQKSKSGLRSALRSFNASGGAKTAKALARMPQDVRGSEEALKTVMAEYQATRNSLATALRGQRSARDAMFLANGNLREAQALFGETRAAALESAKGIATAARTNASNVLSKASGRAAKYAPTTIQRMLMAVDDAGNAVSGAARSTGRFMSRVGSAINPFARGSEKAAEEAVKKGIIRRFTGAVAGKTAKYTVGLPSTIEAAVAKRTAGNFAGRLLRGATAAKSNALGFAIGSWIDAGLNAYDYYTDPTNKVGPGEITIGGRTAKFHEPGILDAVASKEYVKEVAKGFGRVLTLGFWGSGDDTFLDKWAEGNPAAEAAKLNEYIDSGRDPYTGKILTDSEGKALVTDPGKNERILKQAKAGWKDNTKKLSAGSQTNFEYGFRHYLGSLVAEKNAKLQTVENNVANWNSFSKTLGGQGHTPEKYRDTATKNLTRRYDGYIEAALSNPMAKAVADANRTQAYRLYTGRDYERDYAAEGAKAGSVEGFKEFNDDWNSLDDLQRATWDYAAEKKAYDAAVAAPAEEDK